MKTRSMNLGGVGKADEYIQNTCPEILKGLVKIKFGGSRSRPLLRALAILAKPLITNTHMVTHSHP